MMILRARVVWTGVAGTPAYSNFYADQAIQSASAMHAAVTALILALKPVYSSGVTATVEGDVVTIDSATDNIVSTSSFTPTSSAGSASAILPPATQILVRFLTGAYANGRQVRGRFFIPYVSTATLGPTGDVAAATLTTINGALNGYFTAMTATAPVVYSRKNLNGFPITSRSVWNRFAVMRSRRD